MTTIQQQQAESVQEQEAAGQLAKSDQEQKAGGSKQLAESDNKQEAGGSDRFCSNYLETLFPHVLDSVHGSIDTYSTGSIQALFVTDPNMLADCKPLDRKPCYLQQELGALFGMGIFTSNGKIWQHERAVIFPEFFRKKVEGMVDFMVKSAKEMLASLENKFDKEGGSAEVVVDDFLRTFSADVISRACFGSSFSESKEIFSKIRQLQMALAEEIMLFGGRDSRCLPTNVDEIRSLDESIRSLILNIANKRPEHNSATPANNKDLFLIDSIIEGAKKANSLISSTTPEDDFIVDNCKNIFFAGHETTSTTAAWCLMLLASHPKWQTRARDEVLKVYGCEGKPDANTLGELNTVTAVIRETLRLYPPMPFVMREAPVDLKLGDRDIPGGTNIYVPIALVHRDPVAWRASADGFDPGRFVGGRIAGACKPVHMNMPFGMGARTCAGQNLAVAELKVVLALLLQKFEFELSPRYVHAPAFRLSVEPGKGVPLILKKLNKAAITVSHKSSTPIITTSTRESETA